MIYAMLVLICTTLAMCTAWCKGEVDSLHMEADDDFSRWGRTPPVKDAQPRKMRFFPTPKDARPGKFRQYSPNMLSFENGA